MANVTAAKPATGGALYVGATSATLPTTVDAQLTGFTGLGFISEDGLTNANTRTAEKIKAWGGATVLATQTEYEDTFQCTLIDTLDINVLKEVYGEDNVTGTLLTGITIKANEQERVSRAWVVDMVMAEGVKKRITIPSGKISEIGEITYKDDEAVGYEITIEATPDTTGNTHYEYIKSK